MRTIYLLLACVIPQLIGIADCLAKTTSVKGYFRKDGTYVRPHTRIIGGVGSSATPRTGYRTTYASEPRIEMPSESTVAESEWVELRRSMRIWQNRQIITELRMFTLKFPRSAAGTQAKSLLSEYERLQKQRESDSETLLAKVRKESTGWARTKTRDSLSKFVADYSDTPAADEAQRWLDELTRQLATEQGKFAKLKLDEAESLREEKNFAGAEKVLIDLIQEYPSTNEANSAQQLLVTIRKEKSESDRLNRFAQEKLRLAKQFFERGQPATGKKWLADVQKEYPGTRAADEARDLLQSKY